MPNHSHIYAEQARVYDRLIAKQPSLRDTINAIRPIKGLDVVDAGAGTGRLAAVLAAEARGLTALDASEAMLEIAAEKLASSGLPPDRWRCIAADNRSLPLPDGSCDLLVSGWSVCYLASSSTEGWQERLAATLSEYKRVLRPGGTLILFETMGTGTEEPSPPSFLLEYYNELRERYGFSEQVIRLDYTFSSQEEAEELTGFFFGEQLSNKVREHRWITVPENAGVWSTTVSV
jgi:ubiquinone/menaquinone biosynthesis C-methylase UbiE